MYAAPKYRGKGLSLKLANIALIAAKEKKAKKSIHSDPACVVDVIIVTTADSNDGYWISRSLLEKQNFKISII